MQRDSAAGTVKEPERSASASNLSTVLVAMEDVQDVAREFRRERSNFGSSPRTLKKKVQIPTEGDQTPFVFLLLTGVFIGLSALAPSYPRRQSPC